MSDDTGEESPVAGEEPGESPSAAPELVIITGMSGAGRSEAMHTFEDLGFFCIDNLPPSFISQLVELTSLPGSRVKRLAVVCDVRAQEFFAQFADELSRLERSGVAFRLLFFEADDDVLLRRFRETRRRHPMGESGSILEVIHAERDALAPIRERADAVIDTSMLRPQELRRVIRDRFLRGGEKLSMAVTVSSFGFKYGQPTDADIVMDVRFLPNPYYDPALRDLSGLDGPVRDFVLGRDETALFLERWFALLKALMPAYLEEGKHHLSIALGCTGGMHRSVTLAEETAAFLSAEDFQVAVVHRDVGRDRAGR